MQVVYFYPLDIRMRLIGQNASMVLFGRTTSGKPISVIDNNYNPYFYLVPKENAALTNLANFSLKVKDDHYAVIKLEPIVMRIAEKDTPVLKAYVNNPLGITHLAA